MRITPRCVRVDVFRGEVLTGVLGLQIDRIDANYFNVSDRINLAEETRVNATSEEAENWRKENTPSTRTFPPFPLTHFPNTSTATPPNFITEIFYLTLAMNHYGYQKTISTFEELAKTHDDMVRHREQLEGDGSWRQVCSLCRCALLILLGLTRGTLIL